eukprot:1148576-Pelagomonas_calceolata.AAC.1
MKDLKVSADTNSEPHQPEAELEANKLLSFQRGVGHSSRLAYRPPLSSLSSSPPPSPPLLGLDGILSAFPLFQPSLKRSVTLLPLGDKDALYRWESMGDSFLNARGRMASRGQHNFFGDHFAACESSKDVRWGLDGAIDTSLPGCIVCLEQNPLVVRIEKTCTFPFGIINASGLTAAGKELLASTSIFVDPVCLVAHWVTLGCEPVFWRVMCAVFEAVACQRGAFQPPLRWNATKL